MKRNSKKYEFLDLPKGFQEEILMKEIKLNKGNISLDLINELIALYTKGIQYYDSINKNELSFYFSNKCQSLISYADENNILSSERIEEEKIKDKVVKVSNMIHHTNNNLRINEEKTLNNPIINLKEDKFISNTNIYLSIENNKIKNEQFNCKKVLKSNTLVSENLNSSFDANSKKLSCESLNSENLRSFIFQHYKNNNKKFVDFNLNNDFIEKMNSGDIEFPDKPSICDNELKYQIDNLNDIDLEKRKRQSNNFNIEIIKEVNELYNESNFLDLEEEKKIKFDEIEENYKIQHSIDFEFLNVKIQNKILKKENLISFDYIQKRTFQDFNFSIENHIDFKIRSFETENLFQIDFIKNKLKKEINSNLNLENSEIFELISDKYQNKDNMLIESLNQIEFYKEKKNYINHFYIEKSCKLEYIIINKIKGYENEINSTKLESIGEKVDYILNNNNSNHKNEISFKVQNSNQFQFLQEKKFDQKFFSIETLSNFFYKIEKNNNLYSIESLNQIEFIKNKNCQQFLIDNFNIEYGKIKERKLSIEKNHLDFIINKPNIEILYSIDNNYFEYNKIFDKKNYLISFEINSLEYISLKENKENKYTVENLNFLEYIKIKISDEFILEKNIQLDYISEGNNHNLLYNIENIVEIQYLYDYKLKEKKFTIEKLKNFEFYPLKNYKDHKLTKSSEFEFIIEKKINGELIIQKLIEMDLTSEKENIKLTIEKINETQIISNKLKKKKKNSSIINKHNKIQKLHFDLISFFKSNGLRNIKNILLNKKVKEGIDDFSKNINVCEEKLKLDTESQLNIFEERKQKKQKYLNEKRVERGKEKQKKPGFIFQRKSGEKLIQNMMINSIILDEKNAEEKHNKLKLLKEVMTVAQKNPDDDNKKMIDEITEFLTVLTDEYQKDIDNTKNRFKELDELNDLAEFDELAEIYKDDLENELEAIKNDFEMKKEIGLKNIRKKYNKNISATTLSNFNLQD